MGQTFLVEEIRGEMLKGLGSLRFGILFWGGVGVETDHLRI